MFFSIFAVTVLVQKFLFAESWMTLVFCSIAGYTTQHVAFQFFSMVTNLMGLNKGTGGLYDKPADCGAPNLDAGVVSAIMYAVVYILVYWHVFWFIANKIRRDKVIVIENASLVLLLGVCVMVDIVINALVTYNSYEVYNETYVVLAAVSGIVCGILALAFQFKLLSQRDLQEELDKAYHMLRQEQKQYDASKANIDLINLKCHDLKHQIRRIGRSGSLSDAAIKEIEDVITIYDCAVKTGNDVLDTILTEKSLQCEKLNISLTCIVDGPKLGFINEVDLYTLFGNAFDNAIEAVSELSEERRAISLTTKTAGNLFSVCLRNFCRPGITLVDGLPPTTKQNKDYHGFGMKSIKSIVEKYGGTLSVVPDGDIFNLNLLFEL